VNLAAAIFDRRDTLTSAQPVQPWQSMSAAPVKHSLSLAPPIPLFPVAQFEIERKQENGSPERRRRAGFFSSSSSTSHIAGRQTGSGGRRRIRSLHSGFQRMSIAPKKKSGIGASENQNENDEKGGAASNSKPRTGLNGSSSKPANGSKAWWTPANNKPAVNPSSSKPEQRDSAIEDTGQRIRCVACRLRRIAICTHVCPQFDAQPDPQPERRAPIPSSWQDADWEERRRLKQETDVWIAAQIALDVHEPEAAERPPSPNVMARGRPRLNWEEG
jgi:hypothetical protein